MSGLALGWLPLITGALSTVQAVRLLKYVERYESRARVCFTAAWSAVYTCTLLYADTVGSFDDAYVVPTLSIGSSLIIAGWLWSAQDVIRVRSAITNAIQTGGTQ